MKNKIPGLLGVALTVAITAGACSHGNEPSEGLVLNATETTAVTTTPPSSEATQTDLSSALDTIVNDTGVPAVGAAIFDSDGLVDIAVSGVRERGSDAEVTVDDRFHLGSNTKAMTAALFARLAEQGSGVTLETTAAEAFPDVDVHPDYAAVTMAQLMRHSGGVPALEGIPDSLRELPVTEARVVGAAEILSEPSDIPAGTLARYSNSNYILIGAALEAATGQSWEELMTTEVFEPLGMDSCGFGPPGAEDEADEPRGHDENGRPVFLDNAPMFGPAGTVHCSMTDWGNLLVELLNATKGESDFLTQESAESLFEPGSVPVEGLAGARNALGWVVLDGPRGPVYWHGGSNTFWNSQAVIDPTVDGVILTIANEARTGQQAADMALAVLTDMLRA